MLPKSALLLLLLHGCENETTRSARLASSVGLHDGDALSQGSEDGGALGVVGGQAGEGGGGATGDEATDPLGQQASTWSLRVSVPLVAASTVPLRFGCAYGLAQLSFNAVAATTSSSSSPAAAFPLGILRAGESPRSSRRHAHPRRSTIAV